MTIKVYVSLISCSLEVRKNQQRIMMILESKNIPYSIIDITDPCNEDAKTYMVENAEPLEGCKVPCTPQIFNEADYCGDFYSFDMANECDTLGEFLKLSEEEKSTIKVGITDVNADKKDNITNGQSQERREGFIPEKGSLDEVTIERKDLDVAAVKEIEINGELDSLEGADEQANIGEANEEEGSVVISQEEDTTIEITQETEQSPDNEDIIATEAKNDDESEEEETSESEGEA